MAVPHHTVHGPEDRPALVLLHSGGMAGREWEDHVEPLSRRHRLLIPDLPGHGKTPLEDEALTVAGMASAVLALLDEHDLEQAHLVGSSMGGAVALHLGLEHPGRVDRLVLFRTGYRKREEEREATLALAHPERWERLGMDHWLSEVHEPQGGPEAWKQVIARVAETFDPRKQEDPRSLGELEGLGAPTLLVVGDRDPLVPLSEVLDMHATIRDSELWVLPGATHIVGVRTWRRALFDTELERFLRRKRPGH